MVLDPQESPGEIKRRGGGAGPPREPRRDQEQGGGARLRKLDNCPLLELFLNSCATDTVFVTRLRKAVEKAVSGVHKLLRNGEVPTCLNVAACCSGGGPRPLWSFEGRIARTNHSLFVSRFVCRLCKRVYLRSIFKLYLFDVYLFIYFRNVGYPIA